MPSLDAGRKRRNRVYWADDDSIRAGRPHHCQNTGSDRCGQPGPYFGQVNTHRDNNLSGIRLGRIAASEYNSDCNRKSRSPEKARVYCVRRNEQRTTHPLAPRARCSSPLSCDSHTSTAKQTPPRESDAVSLSRDQEIFARSDGLLAHFAFYLVGRRARHRPYQSNCPTVGSHMSHEDPRLTLIVQLVAVGEEMNRLADLPLRGDEFRELWNSLNSQRTTLWRHLGVDKSMLISAPACNGTA